MKRCSACLCLLMVCFSVGAQQLLSLEDCRKLALENNKQAKIGKEKVTLAEEEKKAAFTQYLPNLSFSGVYLRNQKNISLLDADKYLPIGTVMPDGSFGFTTDQVNNQWVESNGSFIPLDANGQPFNPSLNPEKILWKEHAIIPKESFEMDIKNIFVGNFSLVQPVFMGGKIAAYNKITDYSLQLAKQAQGMTNLEIVVHVEEVYWQTVSLTNKKKLADYFVSLLDKMDHDMQVLIEEGMATRADGLSVKVKKNEAEMTQMQANNGLQLSKMLLCQLCGLPLDEPLTLVDEQNPVFSTGEAPALPDMNQTFSNRLELQSLDLATKIYKKKEAVVRSEMLPTVALTGNYLLSNPNSFNGFETRFDGMWNVGIMVQVPIFHFGEHTHKLRAAKAETRIRQLEMDEAKEKVELQVNQAYFKTNESMKKLQAATKNKENADENLRYANTGFIEGVIPASNLMEAQTAWHKAQSEYIDAQIEVKISQLQLTKATGNLTIE
ncbi:TolC family protein [Bacteroidales bacterium OttesenSCG-928-J19]|nr:TolC family protein [Bacteroidales bacterium OttesenSCG-928-J19]